MNIPKYVTEILGAGRLKPAPVREQDDKAYGYTFRLYRLSNHQWPATLEDEAARLCAWARREHADAYTGNAVYYTDKEHRKPFYKRDYILITITDPVAQAFERLQDRKEAPAWQH